MHIERADSFRRPLRQRRQPAERLRAAICALAGPGARVLAHDQQSWASITFSGERHAIELRFEGAAAIARAEAFLDALPDHEFAIPGQIVADAGVVSVVHALAPSPHMIVRIELLLLEDH